MNTIRRLATRLERSLDKGRHWFKQRFNLLDPLRIQAYRGYGNENVIYLHGRILEKEGLKLPEQNASLWENLKVLYHRYESDEIPGAQLSYRMGKLQGSLKTNDEGFFRTKLSNEEGKTGWQPVHFTLHKPLYQGQPEVEQAAEVLLQHPASSFGLISDLDDTVIVSRATDFIRKIRLILTKNERTRKPFPGVSNFYRALVQGADGTGHNPVFYLSSSSWNMYDMFKQFCELHDLPKGVFLLRDVGLDKDKFYRTGHLKHKLGKISNVLSTFNNLPFLLIGDSGQKDPEIYQEVVQQHPGRILGIYIRDVHPKQNKKRDLDVQAIARQVTAAGVPMKLVGNSLEAAQDAVEKGWIPARCLDAIRSETEKDSKNA